MEFVERFGAVAAFVLVVIRMLLDSQSSRKAQAVLADLQRHHVTPERLGRMLHDLERRFEVLPEVLLSERTRQVDETHEAVRDLVRELNGRRLR